VARGHVDEELALAERAILESVEGGDQLELEGGELEGRIDGADEALKAVLG
jgi:hypothetical protein